MSLTAGQRLGPYEILASIGAGGMGEVYRARDTRLDRSVAVKVLPAGLSRDASFKARFEREAKAISALNHPNICTLHDIGFDGTLDYLVMEYIEGDSLADRLRKGPLPLEQVLRFGVQIASALDAAHRQGIVHRDLKPGNVMLTKSGAKLLDFGLAKESAAGYVAQSGITEHRTEHKPLTAEGTMVGTFQYMAPEQLEGSEVDARTDIFAFGALLYEMTTGARAFDGKTRTSIIAAIVSSQPTPISSLQPMTPPALEHVIRRCLAKDPDDRWQSAADIAGQLQWISETGSQTVPLALRRKRALSRYLWPAVAVVAGLVGGALGWSLLSEPRDAPSISHFLLGPSSGGAINLGHGASFAISPDESTIVYRGRSGSGSEVALFLRKTTGFEPMRIEGSEDGRGMTFSPDGRWIAFQSGDILKKVSVDGGKPIDLCALGGGAVGIDWSGAMIVFNEGFSDGIWSIPPGGGEKKLLFQGDAAKNEGALVHPQLLPGGEHVLYTIWRGKSFDDADIAVRSLATGEQKILIRGGSDARLLPTGHIVYGRAGTLLAVPFDLERMEVLGTPVMVLDNVATGSINGEVHVSFSDRGTLLFAPGGALREESDLVWVTREGEATPVVTTRRNYEDPNLAPDGRTIAFVIESSTFDIWILDIERDSINRLSFGANDYGPVWSPDGTRVAWNSTRTGNAQVFLRSADGSGEELQLTRDTMSSHITSWSADEKTIALRRLDAGSANGDVWLLDIDEKGPPKPFLETPFEEGVWFSPDGRWLALYSDESGTGEIYVTPYPGPGRKLKVSIDGGTNPVWSRDGREIFYRQGLKLFAANFDSSRMVTVGRPQLLFEGRYLDGFDVAPDGRFLMVRFDETNRTITSINAVAGWFDELNRRVPLD